MENYTREKIKNPNLFHEAIRTYNKFYGEDPKIISISANEEYKVGIQDLETGIEVVVRDVDTKNNPDGIDKYLNEVNILKQGLKQGKILDFNLRCDENNLVKTAYIIKKSY